MFWIIVNVGWTYLIVGFVYCYRLFVAETDACPDEDPRALLAALITMPFWPAIYLHRRGWR